MKDVLEGLIKQAISMFLTEAVVKKAKDMFIAELEKLALSTDNQLDDTIVKIVKDALK
jgi:hypothetical protein